MSREYRYVSEGLRRISGTICTVHEDQAVIECTRCRCNILPGSYFTLSRNKDAKPLCRDCEPFDMQLTIFDMDSPR